MLPAEKGFVYSSSLHFEARTLRHAMHKLGYGILIQFDVMCATQVGLWRFSASSDVRRMSFDRSFRISIPERGLWYSSSMHFEACSA